MLVLTRKVGERILIGDDIVLTILDSRGDGIRVGIDAPRGIKVQREEVVKAVAEANVEAAAAAAGTADDAEARLRDLLGGQAPAAGQTLAAGHAPAAGQAPSAPTAPDAD